ncbi:DUF2164 domain-containing protein [Metabacillus sp. RGM 3146]|uniref:DUF2164 domain-containing protein n=1 Tax=Metabacillus sp. RGM 3146 TaxID=3401092 RepID=UPI003B9CD502
MEFKLNEENKQDMIGKIQLYFSREREEEIGDLAAELFLDFFLKEVGPFIYNQGIADARTSLNEKMADLEEVLYALERPVRKA